MYRHKRTILTVPYRHLFACVRLRLIPILLLFTFLAVSVSGFGQCPAATPLDPGVISSGGTYCSGHNPTIGGVSSPYSAASAGGGVYTYTWQIFSGGVWTDIPNTNFATYNSAGQLTTTTQYRRKVEDNCGIVEYSNVATYTIVADPTVSITGSSSVCQDASLTLGSTVSGGVGTYTYKWQSSTDGVSWADVASGDGLNTYSPVTNTPGTFYFKLTLDPNLASCNNSSATFTLTVDPKPTVTSSSTATICSGSATNISLTSNIASTFSWTVGTVTGGITGATPGSGTSITQTLTNPGTTAGTVQYLVTPTSNPGGCAGDV
ncbi:MAG: PKD-like domain-containing protein, partial [Flavisolibacter sp.]